MNALERTDDGSANKSSKASEIDGMTKSPAEDHISSYYL